MASNTPLPDKDDMVVCPYDPAHVMPALRLQRHLVKCAKNHPNSNLMTCPFNFLHRIPRAERKHHVANCPDRQRIDEDLIYQQEKQYQHGNINVPAYDAWEFPPDSAENWDADQPWDAEEMDPVPYNRQGQSYHAQDWQQHPPSQQFAWGQRPQDQGYSPEQQQHYRRQQQHQLNQQPGLQQIYSRNGPPQHGHCEQPQQNGRQQQRQLNQQPGLQQIYSRNGPPQQNERQQQYADYEEVEENWDDGWNPRRDSQPANNLNNGPSLRMPREEPQVMQLARQQQRQQQQSRQSPPEFTPSLSLAGIGRGKRGRSATGSPPGVLHARNGLLPNGSRPQSSSGPVVGQMQGRMQENIAPVPNVPRGRAAILMASGATAGASASSEGQQGLRPVGGRQRARGRGRGLSYADLDAAGGGHAQMVPCLGNGVFNGNGQAASAQPPFVVPRTVALKDNEIEATRSSSSSPSSLDSEEHIKKEMRKVSKKLREIEVLEARKASGQPLNNDQLGKLEKKQELDEQLASLQQILENVD